MKLLELLDQSQFPHKVFVGGTNEYKAFIILLHFDGDRNNVLLGDHLKLWLRQGFLSPRRYATIIDKRRAYALHKRPIYYELPAGIHNLTDKEIQAINIERNKIGLAPLFAFKKVRGKLMVNTKNKCPRSQEQIMNEWIKLRETFLKKE